MLTEDVPEEKNNVLERGTMIHEYLLQPEEFQKDYVIWNKSRPTSAQQEQFCQALAFSTEIEPNRAILDAYKQAYSTRGKSEDLMLSEGLKIASTLKDYIDFLKANDGRIMISHWDVKMLEQIKHNIQSHKLANKIIWPKGIGGTYNYTCPLDILLATGPLTFETFHEFHINWTYYVEMAAKVECKSLLDGITIDFEKRKVIIYDLKTTQKLWHFEDSIDQYDYLRQLCYYHHAALWYVTHECETAADSWTFEYYIIAIDTTGSHEIRVFKIDDRMVQSRSNVIHSTLRDIFWHQATDKWEHSREYYEGDGSESLNL
jgi:hypothetical protein